MPRGNYDVFDDNYDPEHQRPSRKLKKVCSMTPNERTVRQMASVLRKQCRPLLPVRIYFRSKLPGGDQGSCVLSLRKGSPKCFSIFIKKSTKDSMIDALVHEWAHALSWTEGEMIDVDDHCAAFGIAQARCWRALRDFD